MMVRSSAATIMGLAVQYAAGGPLLTDRIGEWIMARTPSEWALTILDVFGPWAKPFAATGGLSLLGGTLLLVALLQSRFGRLRPVAGASLFALADPQNLLFWLPALGVLLLPELPPAAAGRRAFFVMSGGTALVAVESFWREKRLAAAAVPAMELYPFSPPESDFGKGLVRAAVTPVGEFYTMSKNTVDPMITPDRWKLRITVDGTEIRSWTYAELMALPRRDCWVTLRCISNTLRSNLMGTAHWSGVGMEQLLPRGVAPAGAVELAVIGVDGHGDSIGLDYAYSEGLLFALGMNGKTLNRAHGYPLRMLSPRYYGLKNVKWIGELRFVTQPYVGTWPKLGYTKEPRTHVATTIDKIRRESGRLLVGGVSFAGDRGIQSVEVRVDGGPWQEAKLERPLSPYTWTRWIAETPAGTTVEARAQDGQGNWQAAREGPLFPDGVKGPTVRKI